MLKFCSKILYILEENTWKLITLAILFIANSSFEAFGIGIVGPFISLASHPEIVQKNRILRLLYDSSGLSSTSYFVAIFGLAIIVVFGVKALVNWQTRTAVFGFAYKKNRELALRLMTAYLDAPYTFHVSNNSAHVITVINSYTQRFTASTLIPLLMSLTDSAIVIAISVVLCLTSPFAVAALVLVAVPTLWLFSHYKDKIKLWGKQASEANREQTKVVNHGLGSIKETKVIGCQAYFKEQLGEQAKIAADASTSFFRFKLLPRMLVEMILIVSLLGSISIFLLLKQDIQQLNSVLGVFALASIRLIPAISNVAGNVSTVRNSSYPVDVLFKDLRKLENLSQSEEALDRSTLLIRSNKFETNEYDMKSMIFKKNMSLQKITYCYPNASESALVDVSINIHKGQSIGLIGKSGAGKTTLVDVILGLLIPQDGDIRVDGNSIYEDLRSWQNLIGYIPQTIFLLDDTVEKNIAFGVPDHLIDQARLIQAIEAAQLSEVIDNLPSGLDTRVGERGVMLSGGQRQRVGIARALYHGRDILILDEATAALDNETESLITEAIESLAGAKTIIVIAHRLTTLEHCDRIYVMDKGRVLNSGSYEEIVLKKHAVP